MRTSPECAGSVRDVTVTPSRFTYEAPRVSVTAVVPGLTTDSPRVKLRTYAPPLVVYAPVGVPIATLSHGDVASRAGAAEAVENENAERPPAPSRNDASV